MFIAYIIYYDHLLGVAWSIKFALKFILYCVFIDN